MQRTSALHQEKLGFLPIQHDHFTIDDEVVERDGLDGSATGRLGVAVPVAGHLRFVAAFRRK
jgi:hypothetical protein